MPIEGTHPPLWCEKWSTFTYLLVTIPEFCSFYVSDGPTKSQYLDIFIDESVDITYVYVRGVARARQARLRWVRAC